MSRAGRKRKEGERHPSGKLVQIVRHVPSPTAIRRALDAAIVLVSDASLGSQLGWLRLQGMITDKQMAAGMSFASLFHRYSMACGFPSRSPKAISYQRGAHGQDNRPENEGVVAAIKNEYQTVAAGLHQAGALEITVNVCVDDMPASWSDRIQLVRGLDVLSVHFRL